jgi:Carboxypeptidase regulatory-like domain
MRRLIQRLSALAAIVCLLPATVGAQDTTGSISGTITDQQKGMLPGVTILVRQLDTGVERTQVSDEHGRYRVLNLTPGPYTVTAQMEGFRPVLRDQLTVAIGKDLLVDIEMTLGGIAEQVTVAGETSNVSLGSTTIGGLVTTQQIS